VALHRVEQRTCATMGVREGIAWLVLRGDEEIQWTRCGRIDDDVVSRDPLSELSWIIGIAGRDAHVEIRKSDWSGLPRRGSHAKSMRDEVAQNGLTKMSRAAEHERPFPTLHAALLRGG
jgi:hypothetical protein